jgi:hypothetical protein
LDWIGLDVKSVQLQYQLHFVLSALWAVYNQATVDKYYYRWNTVVVYHSTLRHRSGNRQPKTYVKPEAAVTVFELLMMRGVSPETC